MFERLAKNTVERSSTLINNYMKITDVISQDRLDEGPVWDAVKSGANKLFGRTAAVSPLNGKVTRVGRIPSAAMKYITVIKWLGFLPFLEEWWSQRQALDQQVADGTLSKADEDVALRQIAEQMVVKIMATQKFASLLSWIIRLTVVGRVAAYVAAGGASVATLGLLGGPSVIALLATTAGAIWLEKFLGTEDGKQIIANVVMYAIDPTLTWLWNQGPGAWISSLHANGFSDKAGDNDKLQGTLHTDGKTSDSDDNKPNADIDATSDSGGYMDKIKRLLAKFGGGSSPVTDVMNTYGSAPGVANLNPLGVKVDH